MAHSSKPKMSLMGQFDDLCRYTDLLTSGPEKEFKIFAEGQLNCLRKWSETNLEVAKLKEEILNLETENKHLEENIKDLEDSKKEADAAKEKIQSEKNLLARQIAIIREVLLADGGIGYQTREKIFLLSKTCKTDFNSPPHPHTIEGSAGSLLSPSEIDETDEDLESRSRRGRKSKGKRSSSYGKRASQKKKRLDEDNTNAHYADIALKNNSECVSSSPDFLTSFHQDYKYNTSPFNYTTNDEYDTANSHTPVSHRTVRQVGKNHQFVTKKAMNREECVVCKQNIALRNKYSECKNCGFICHPACIKQCSVICFPVANMPTQDTAGTVVDYTSSSSPMIPPLIVHCVREIESRGLKYIGLYKVSSSERDVKSLRKKFVPGHPIPRLNDVDIHVLCSVIKDFLCSLREPLIPCSARQSFVDATKLKNDKETANAFYRFIIDLPQPNRDTLSFLILHLQEIVKSPFCRTDAHNLATVFGPVVVGYSTADSARRNIFKETTDQHQVMKHLLSLPNEFWQKALSVVKCENFRRSVKGTPENLPAPRTRLGTVYSSVQKRQSLQKEKTNFKKSKPKKPKYFLSPFRK